MTVMPRGAGGCEAKTIKDDSAASAQSPTKKALVLLTLILALRLFSSQRGAGRFVLS
jgi:hypothetical protein